MQKAQPKQRPVFKVKALLKVKALPKLKVLCTCQQPSNCH